VGVLFEIKGGPMAGQRIALATGQSIVIGRAAAKAQFAVPHDTFMSGAHFAIDCSSQGCRVVDKKSSNGTFLNGARIQDAMLANGDEIKSGQTIFTVRIVPDERLPTPSPSPAGAVSAESVRPAPSVAEPGHLPKPAPAVAPPQPGSVAPVPWVAPPAPTPAAAPRAPAPVMLTGDQGREAESASGLAPERPAPARAPASTSPAPAIAKPAISPPMRAAGISPKFSVMGWSFFTTPEQWQVQVDFGLQRSVGDEFPSSVVATQEHLAGISLQQFVESQISMLRQYLRDPKIEPAMPPRISGSEETMAVDVRHSTKDGKELVYRRIYARCASSVGVLTVTTLASELPQILKTLQPLLDTVAFQSATNT
jgi:FHA domain